jgi:transposase
VKQQQTIKRPKRSGRASALRCGARQGADAPPPLRSGPSGDRLLAAGNIESVGGERGSRRGKDLAPAKTTEKPRRPARDRHRVTSHGKSRGLEPQRRQSRTRKEPVMSQDITFVGLDAHKKSITVAMLPGNEKKAMEWEVRNEAKEIRKLARKLKSITAGEIRCCYEAGPTGFGLQRALEAEGIICEVIAPSLIPVKAGDRIKTDRRDAKKLAELLRANLLTEVRAPTPEEEAVRDLCRCREDAKEDQTRARHRLGKFLLRRSMIYVGGKSWTKTHLKWMNELQFGSTIDRAVFEAYRHALDLADERVKALDSKLDEVAKQEPFASSVGWLRCYHGIDTIGAMIIVAELFDIRRFESARSLMAYLGLVPSESSSGARTSRGAITKAGNSHVRRILVEAAHHYRHAPKKTRRIAKRRDGQPLEAIAIADRAHLRLNQRYWRLMSCGKPTNKAKVAVARELAGFIWSTLRTCGLHQRIRAAEELKAA